MGQVQSEVAAFADDGGQIHPHPNSPPNASSMDSLLAEAAAYGNDGNESLDVKAQKALECPCIADLRNGSCGTEFSEAFLCFLKSTAEEKGSDCVHPFVALQKCIKANPDAFTRDALEDEGKEVEEEAAPEYRIIAPLWSKDSATSKPPKSRL